MQALEGKKLAQGMAVLFKDSEKSLHFDLNDFSRVDLSWRKLPCGWILSLKVYSVKYLLCAKHRRRLCGFHATSSTGFWSSTSLLAYVRTIGESRLLKQSIYKCSRWVSIAQAKGGRQTVSKSIHIVLRPQTYSTPDSI